MITKIMKKTAWLAMAAMVIAACAKEVAPDTPETPQVDPQEELAPGTVVLKVGFEAPETQDPSESKVAVSDSGVLTWKTDDQIAVWTSNGASGKFCTFTLYTGNGEKTATFTGTPDEGYSVSTLAVYPASAAASYDGETLTVTYPDTYEYGTGAQHVRMAAYFDNVEEGLTFKHLGGLIRFNITNIPAGVNCFKLSADKPISGDFTVSASKEVSSTTTEADEVEIAFEAGMTEGQFSVPVPVGTFDLTAALYTKDGDTYTLCKKSQRSTTQTFARKAYRQMRSYSVVAGGTYYVKTTAAGEKDGSSWANATTLEQALFWAEDGETIKVAAGTYTAAESLKADDENWNVFWVRTGCTVEGGYAGSSEDETPDYDSNVTILDAAGAYHALVINSAATAAEPAIVKGFTLKGGVSASDATSQVDGEGAHLSPNIGAGLLVRGGDAQIENCKIQDNNPSAAARNYKTAVYIQNATGKGTKLFSCTLTGNSNVSAGVIAAGGNVQLDNTVITKFDSDDSPGSALRVTGGNVILNNCDVKYNSKATASHEGIIFNSAGNVSFVGGYIRDNSATSIVYNWSGEISLDNVTFIRNNGPSGGFNNKGTLILKNCSITKNDYSGTARGGLIWNQGTLKIDACDISTNTHKGYGCVLYSFPGDTTTPTYYYITNSSFTFNTSDSISAFYCIGASNGIMANCTFYENKENGYDSGTTTGKGQIYLNHTSKLYMISCTMQLNRSYNYGAIFPETTTSLYFYNTLIAGNASNSNTSFYKDAVVNAAVKEIKGSAIGVDANAYGRVSFYNPAGTFVKKLGSYQTHLSARKRMPNNTIVIPIQASEATQEAPSLVLTGMPVADLKALSIDLGQGVFDASAFGYDQAGNERTGTTIGAYVGD